MLIFKIVVEMYLMFLLYLGGCAYVRIWLCEEERTKENKFFYLYTPFLLLTLFMVVAIGTMPFCLEWVQAGHGQRNAFDPRTIASVIGFPSLAMLPILFYGLSMTKTNYAINDIGYGSIKEDQIITGWFLTLTGPVYYRGPASRLTGFWARNFVPEWFVKGFWIESVIAHDRPRNKLTVPFSLRATKKMPYERRKEICQLAINKAQTTLTQAMKDFRDIREKGNLRLVEKAFLQTNFGPEVELVLHNFTVREKSKPITYKPNGMKKAA